MSCQNACSTTGSSGHFCGDSCENACHASYCMDLVGINCGGNCHNACGESSCIASSWDDPVCSNCSGGCGGDASFSNACTSGCAYNTCIHSCNSRCVFSGCSGFYSLKNIILYYINNDIGGKYYYEYRCT